jgi:hypothetical protein
MSESKTEAEMAKPNHSTESRPNWIARLTLLISSAALLSNISFGLMAYRLDSRIKIIQAQNEEYQARGIVEFRYNVVDIKNFCGSTKDVASFEADHQYTENIYDGFLNNDIWELAERIVTNNCEWAIREMSPQPLTEEEESQKKQALERLSVSVAYIEISTQTKSFRPRVAMEATASKATATTGIWEQAASVGHDETYDLGEIGESDPVRIPVALLNADGKPITQKILVPKSLTWHSPVTKSASKLPLTYIYSKKNWRSIRVGFQRSGA